MIRSLLLCGLFVTASLAQAAPAAPVAAIPFELYHNRVYLPAMVNGRGPFHLVLDTGSALSGLNQTRARELGLKLSGKAQIKGNGQNLTSAQITRHVTFTLGNIELSVGTVVVADFTDLERHEGRPLDGILGAELFRRYVVETDYAARVLRLYEPKSYAYSGRGEVLPLGLIHASIQIAGQAPIPAEFKIDSGTYSALRLYRPFVEKHRLLANVTPTAPSFGFGLGGEFQEVLGRIQVLQLGGLKIEQPVTSFSVASSGYTTTESSAGTFGGEILRRFTVILDSSRKQMILEPNAEFGQPFPADMSGIILLADGPDLKTITVDHVAAGSPASEAGIREGDQIISINDQPAGELGLEDIRLLLQKEAVYRLAIQRGRQTMTVELKTRRMI